MAYTIYVGVNYPSGEKSLEFHPETLTDVAKAVIDLVGEERDGTSFVFTIVPEKKE